MQRRKLTMISTWEMILSPQFMWSFDRQMDAYSV